MATGTESTSRRRRLRFSCILLPPRQRLHIAPGTRKATDLEVDSFVLLVNSGWDASYGLDAWRRSIQPTDRSIPMKKVPASEATRKRLEEVFSGEQIDPSRVVREATRLMIGRRSRPRSSRPWVGSYYAHGRTAGDERPRHCAMAVAEAASIAPRASSNSMPRRCAGSAAGRAKFARRWRARARSSRGCDRDVRPWTVVRDIEATFTDDAGRCVLDANRRPAPSPKRLWGEYQALRATWPRRARHRLPVRRRRRRAAALGPAARGGAGGLGDRTQRLASTK